MVKGHFMRCFEMVRQQGIRLTTNLLIHHWSRLGVIWLICCEKMVLESDSIKKWRNLPISSIHAFHPSGFGSSRTRFHSWLTVAVMVSAILAARHRTFVLVVTSLFVLFVFLCTINFFFCRPNHILASVIVYALLNYSAKQLMLIKCIKTSK